MDKEVTQLGCYGRVWV